MVGLKLDDSWILAASRSSYRSKLPAGGMTIAIRKKTGKDGYYIGLRFHAILAQTMVWEAKDTICFYYNKDNEKKILLVKSENGSGKTLGKETGTGILMMQLKWPGKLQFKEEIKATVVPHKVNKNGTLTFDLPV